MQKLKWIARQVAGIPAMRHIDSSFVKRARRLNVLYNYASSFDAESLIKDAMTKGASAEAGFVKNFQGVKIRPSVMPQLLNQLNGTVEAAPDPGNWHADIAEWGAAFRTVSESGDTFRMLELGCGWGCWMVNTGAYARKLGKKVKLFGIEADASHLADARTTLNENGFNEDEYVLVQGVAAPRAGKALFPSFDAPADNWGGEAIFYPSERESADILATGSHVELNCYPLSEITGGATLDLLHIDIQGAEVQFVAGNFEEISKLVKRVLIGTHSRIIEGQLMDMFEKDGWLLEMERPLVNDIDKGKSSNVIDGVQLWKNAAL